MNKRVKLLVYIFSMIVITQVWAVIAQEADPTPLFGGARPEADVVAETDLLSQPRYPGGSEPLVMGNIDEGDRVIVLDVDDVSRGWFRVLLPGDAETPTLFGWTRIDYVDYSARISNPYAAPPGCTQPLAYLTDLSELWDSTVQGKIAVVVDVFRETREVSFPQSTFTLTNNGQLLRDRARTFRSAGYFLMNGVVISADVREGNVIGFNVDTTSEDTLSFHSIIFYVPEGCDFGD